MRKPGFEVVSIDMDSVMPLRSRPDGLGAAVRARTWIEVAPPGTAVELIERLSEEEV